MKLEEFWEIVERVHLASKGDMDVKCKLLTEELRRLPTSEVKSFSHHFDDCKDKAYTNELWAAAYIIGHGCSDDKFSDFRSTLISMGHSTFEKVVSSSESLVEMDVDKDNAFYEGYQYAPITVYKEMTGSLPYRDKPHPESPTGTCCNEDEEVARLYPRLAAKHHYCTSPRRRWWRFW
ncbi:DUF4240 domain-containing protein [Pedosphaera parvula]|uniref:DUF4240 domain-containing protein n=1 Tax=Pedosphaera parvula (strain Ellin514) TaxID=320771 RepID=B9XLY2_PEDPL|nr:DUF4240 domain-containing protein [Pedosphaera parvula]EEF59110.1 conserved hypothetical protein [Pedosphaera parvula Ellin514]